MPTRLRLSRPEHRLALFQKKLDHPLPEQQRNRLLKRVAAAEKAMTAKRQLTGRDLDILQAIARFRFMTSHQIIRFLTGLSEQELAQQLRKKPWAHQHLSRRISALFDWHLLMRPPQQDLQLSAFGALVYGLTRGGARELLANGCAVNAELDWQSKNARASGLFLSHTLATTQAMLLFDIASRAHQLELLDHHDLVPHLPAATQQSDEPFTLRVTIRHQRQPLTIAVVPDRLFAVRYPDGMVNTFCLELDRGTLDVTAKRLQGKASFARKLTGFYAAFRQGKFLELWNTRSLRMLTVTTAGKKRIASMMEAQRAITQGHANDLFLYITADKLAAHGPFADTWMRADGTTTSILRS